ncbi:hypothetical protein I3J27_18340 [Bradyrhizobium xenonodulans]|uniref:Ribbon-helix-helix protein CopG domain-containing protein n=1 Tax=Bradyrhizobium xenonodulans TaxID=2736875 RepID=A0ABY7N0E8_9BRAD|nr:hypothetical protein [Bradyrhizobium xenonodulans]WBL82292.1 hypothetical protein I3J27_18340 [Bradyrhizobium xenonodulans]
MKKSISVNKKSRGRPKKAGGVYPVSAVRLSPDVGAAVDVWARAQADTPTRSEAIRRLVEIGLKAKSGSRRETEVSKTRKSAQGRARDMASDTIDEMSDATASADDQASRKRRLIKGPEEFRRVRRDRTEK